MVRWFPKTLRLTGTTQGPVEAESDTINSGTSRNVRRVQEWFEFVPFHNEIRIWGRGLHRVTPSCCGCGSRGARSGGGFCSHFDRCGAAFADKALVHPL